MNVLSIEQVKHLAPSVFAERPYEQVSDKYRFFPTHEVLEALVDNGFAPVSAFESRTRKEEKRGFVKHVVRLRHKDLLVGDIGREVPELVLLNSHDGTSAYKLMLGFFRIVCSNGMIVKSAGISEIAVRHSGSSDLVDQVIEGSYQVIEEAPKAVSQVEEWKQVRLSGLQMEAYAAAAVELRDSALKIEPCQLLRVRRAADYSADLWTTFNRVQENLVRGGYVGTAEDGERRHVRGIKSVDANTKLNRALWSLTERMAELAA